MPIWPSAPHCRQLAQELEDLQTQMTSLWVEPPDSLKDALASQDWSKSASSSRPLFPNGFPPSDGTCFRGWPRAAAAVVLVVGLCQLLLPGGADGLLPKAVIEVFQRPEQDPAAGSEESDPAAPRQPRQPARPFEGYRAAGRTEREETPRGGPCPLRTGPPPQTTRRTRSPRPITTKPPTTPPIPPVIPPQRTPAQTHLPTTTQGTNPTIPPPPAVSRQEAQSLLTAYLAQQGRTLTLVPFGLQSQPRLLALFRPGCQRQRRHVPDGLLPTGQISRDSLSRRPSTGPGLG